MSKEAELQTIGHLGEKSEFFKVLEQTVGKSLGVPPALIGHPLTPITMEEAVKRVREAAESGVDASFKKFDDMAVMKALERTRGTPEKTVEAFRKALGLWNEPVPESASPTLGERLDALRFDVEEKERRALEGRTGPEKAPVPDTEPIPFDGPEGAKWTTVKDTDGVEHEMLVPSGRVTGSVGSVTGGWSAHRMEEWGMDMVAKRGMLKWEDMPEFQAAVRAEVERQLARNGMDEPFVKMMVLYIKAKYKDLKLPAIGEIVDAVSEAFPHTIPEEILAEVEKRLDVDEFEMDLEDTGSYEREIVPKIVTPEEYEEYVRSLSLGEHGLKPAEPEKWMEEFGVRPLTPEERAAVESATEKIEVVGGHD